MPQSKVDVNDSFGSFFGNRGGKRSGQSGGSRGSNLRVKIKLNYEEIAKGASKTIKIKKKIIWKKQIIKMKSTSTIFSKTCMYIHLSMLKKRIDNKITRIFQMHFLKYARNKAIMLFYALVEYYLINPP